ncbi:MAG: radical SAM family heme chaperone HemW [Actinomycetota bacterium]
MTATAIRARDGVWLAEPGFGVYVHIPFCLHRCHYCDFNTYEDLDALHAPYVDALVADIERSTRDVPPATSVFFGGGTPTLLAPAQLARVLAAVRSGTGIAPGAEVTIEVNPETVDARKFAALLEVGFNRFSVGIQSFAPHVLESLGRTHSVETAQDALAVARRAGAQDVNADLIYGSPWERPEDWLRSLEGVIDAGTDHVSAYALTVEAGTPLHTLVTTGRVPDVDGDVQAERHALADQYLRTAGFERYETSNWAQPGRASRHNVLYWSAGNYQGFGAGAHAHIDGRRWWSQRLPRDFIAAVRAGRSTEAGSEELDHGRRGPEALMLGLRLTSGVQLDALAELYGAAFLRERVATIERLVEAGALERHRGWLRVSKEATMLADDVICRLL